jgi:hypothetical protein
MPRTAVPSSGRALDGSHGHRPHNARYELELVPPVGGGSGLVVQQTKHVYMETRCACGHWTRAQPGRCEKDKSWTVELSEWHLAGPTLVALLERPDPAHAPVAREGA